MIPRNAFTADHEMFRDTVKRFIEQEIVPHHRRWEDEGMVSREVWLKAGAAGLLVPHAPEDYGGAGADYRYTAIITEEMGRYGATGPGFSVHSEMAAGYILNFGTHEQKAAWLPKMVSGEAIAAIGLSEPAAGSDFKAIKTTAVRDGDDYVINGQKVFISNGQLCDIVMLACKTDPSAGARGMSFIIVETNREGFKRGRNLDKLGLKAQDTSELFFDNVRVPATNLIGQEGQGFAIAMHNLAEERLAIAISALGACEGVLAYTIDYVKERKVFDKTVSDFQNTRFKIAEMTAQTQALRVFVDRCIELAVEKKLDAVEASMAKMLTTELQGKVVDECLQFYGGWGYMMEYQIAHAYIDARIRRIAGGSSEIMREIISRQIFGR